MPDLLTKVRTEELRVFLSYAAGEETEAQAALDALAALPKTRVFTVQDMKLSEKWRETIQQELQSCDLFLLLLTDHAAERNWTLQELGAAMGLRKPIILVIAQSEALKTFPYNLNSFPSVNLQDFTNPSHLRELLLPHRAAPLRAVAENGTQYEAAQQNL